MIVFDTNALLRCYLQDNKEIADSVQERMNRELFIIPTVVIAEIVYVLLKVYRVDRPTIEAALNALIRHENAHVFRRPVIQEALDVFCETKFDFVDCLMIGYAKVEGRRIVTYDKDLQKYLARFWIDSESKPFEETPE